jgi:hypothetical protein
MTGMSRVCVGDERSAIVGNRAGAVRHHESVRRIKGHEGSGCAGCDIKRIRKSDGDGLARNGVGRLEGDNEGSEHAAGWHEVWQAVNWHGDGHEGERIGLAAVVE